MKDKLQTEKGFRIHITLKLLEYIKHAFEGKNM